MNISHRTFRWILPVVLPTVAALVAGHRSWLSREVVISVGLRAHAPVACQVFYTDEPDAGFSEDKSATFFARPRGAEVRAALPVARLERLRFEFGTEPGMIRASPVVVQGAETRTLDWREFTVRHDIGRFEVDAGGAVDVKSSGGDPYAVCSEPLGLRGRLCVNAFAFGVFAVLGVLAGLALTAVPSAARRFAVQPWKEKFRAVAFLVAAFALTAVRLWFSARLPPLFGASAWDDIWFVKAAAALLDGNWLGAYDQHTLCKGCFGPMVLSVSAMLGVSFLLAENILYVLGCAFFVFVLSRIVQNRLFLLVVFGILLFNPLSFSLYTMQRVYRNGMSAWQVPVVFGCLFMAFRAATRKEGGLRPWALVSGVALWAFFNTREDSIWGAPFALVCTAFAFARAWLSGSSRREKTLRALTCLLPILLVLFGNAALCLVNWRVYGLPLRNDRDGGNYAKAMRDLYLIAPDPEDEARLSGPEHAGHYHNIYYSTLCRAYDASPTLASARPWIDGVIDNWAHFQGYSGRDLKFDHMLFAIRDGAAKAGVYRSLRNAEDFFGAVHQELGVAFSDGRFVRRGIPFTAMAAPFRPESVPDIFRAWWRIVAHVAGFRELGAAVMGSDEAGRTTARSDTVPLFERLAHCHEPEQEHRQAAKTAVGRTQVAARVYSACMPWAMALATAAWAVLSVLLAAGNRRVRGLLDEWLFATGILGSLLVHTACMAYMTATTFSAIIYYYLAPSYQLALLFIAAVAALATAAAGRGARVELPKATHP